MSVIRPFDPRVNYTRFHNYLLDVIMPDLKPNSWKVLCFIVRKTTGWNKEAEQLSYSQLRQGTGIKSDPTLSDAIKDLVEHNYILVQKDTWEANTYSLNTTIEFEATIEITVSPTIEITVAPTIETIDTKRKELKKEEKEPIAQKPTAHVEPPSSTLFPLEKEPTKHRKPKIVDSAEEQARKARTTAILVAYVDVRGKNGINYAAETVFARKIDNAGYNPTQVKGCYLWIKKDPIFNGWWEFRNIRLSKILEELDNYMAWLERQGIQANNTAADTTSKKKPAVLSVDWNSI